MLRRLVRPLSASLPFLAAPSLLAQTGQIPCQPPTMPGVVCLQGMISGALQAGIVYHVFPGSSVPLGASLTVEPGTVVKFLDTGLLLGFRINGTLTAGTGAIFTSIYDDAAGGDTNGDGGQTRPAPRDWGGLDFGPNADQSVVDGVTVRYAQTGIALAQADIVLRNSTIQLCSGFGLQLRSSSFPIVTGCTILQNGTAVSGVPLGAVPSFLNNTSGGSTFQDQLEITDDSFPGNVTIGPQNALNGTGQFIICATIVVPAGQTLTLGPGLTIKLTGDCLNGQRNQFDVAGTLLMTGCVLTSLRDDTVGGDWNKDGNATIPAPGDWSGFVFRPTSSASQLRGVTMSYAGRFGTVASVDLESAHVLLDQVIIQDGANHGLALNATSFPSVTGCTIRRNQGKAVIDAHPEAIPGFQGNSATQNTTGDFIQISSGPFTIHRNTTFARSNSIAQDGLFVIGSSLTVAAGATLQLDPGVVFKWNPGTLTVAGTLLASGAGNPVVFTSIHDDAILGDSNKNGNATVPAPGQWQRIHFLATSDASRLEGVRVRWAGVGFGPNAGAAVHLSQADVTLLDVEIEFSVREALNLGGGVNASYPTVDGCRFQFNAFAVDGVPITAVPGFTNCSALGNTLGDSLNVTHGRVHRPTSIAPVNTLNQDGVVVLDADVTIDASVDLALLGGVIFKFDAADFLIATGTLTCGSVGGGPVVFTSMRDDAFGGDTNKDGSATSGAPGDWRQLAFGPDSDGSVLEQVIVRFAGLADVPAVALDGADVTLRDSTVLQCRGTALDLAGNSYPVVQDCHFDDNAFAVDRVPIEALPGFSGSTAVRNRDGDHQRITRGTVSRPLLLQREQALNQGPFVVRVDIDVLAPLGSLSLDGGVLIKFDGARQLDVDAVLRVLGSNAVPVVLTSIHDDGIGGDTNKNGNATVAQPGDWLNVDLGPDSDASVVSGLLIRYAGRGGLSAIDLNASDAVILETTIERCLADALDLNGNSRAQVRRCNFRDCGGLALDGAPLDAVQRFQDNLASGNVLGDHVRITTAGFASPAIVSRFHANNDDGVFAVATSITVPANAFLALRAGTILKWEGVGRTLTVNGTLDVEGTGFEPVVLTVITDDEIAGDTNRDLSATAPTRGDWNGVVVNSAAAAARFEYIRARYAATAFDVDAPVATLVAGSAERCSRVGFDVSALGAPLVNPVAWECGTTGILLRAGTFDLLHATVTVCAVGVQRNAAHRGMVWNSISYDNSSTNYQGFAAGDIAFSNGDPTLAGMQGNLFQDPRFVNAPAGDLRLGPGSPCLNAADLARAIAVGLDHREASRVLDHDLGGVALPDMGAFEREAFSMSVSGRPRSGSSLGFTVRGPSGFSFYFLGLLDGRLFVPPYGVIAMGDLATSLFLTTVPVGNTFDLPLPGSTPPDALAGIQAFTVTAQTIAIGNVCELYRARTFR